MVSKNKGVYIAMVALGLLAVSIAYASLYTSIEKDKLSASIIRNNQKVDNNSASMIRDNQKIDNNSVLNDNENDNEKVEEINNDESETTKKIYYYYDSKSKNGIGKTTNNGTWNAYVIEEQKIKQVCAILNNTTVCIEPNKWDCGTVIDNKCSNENGYIMTMKQQIESSEGIICTLDNSQLKCSHGNISITANNLGSVESIDDEEGILCNVNSQSIIKFASKKFNDNGGTSRK